MGHWKTFRQTIREFLEDDALRLSAAVAYYSVFSLAPLLVICVAIAGMVLGEDAVRAQIDDQLKSSLGASRAFAVQDMVAKARKYPLRESSCFSSVRVVCSDSFRLPLTL